MSLKQAWNGGGATTKDWAWSTCKLWRNGSNNKKLSSKHACNKGTRMMAKDWVQSKQAMKDQEQQQRTKNELNKQWKKEDDNKWHNS